MSGDGRGPLVEFRRAVFSYDGAVAAEAELSIGAGTMVGLVGPSGAGKTTLLRAVVGQVRPRRGEVLLGGRRVGRRSATRVGYVPQLESIDWNFPITVTQVVLLGRVSESGAWPWAGRDDRRAVGALLSRLGVADLADRHIRSLSGGEQQRVFLARALIRQPELLLLDEPTSGLDVHARREMLDLLGELHGDGITVVLTTHDLNSVAATLPEVVCLNRRVVAQGPPAEVLTPEVLRATFGTDMVVLRHDDLLLAADAPAHVADHAHHAHLHHGPAHEDAPRAGSPTEAR